MPANVESMFYYGEVPWHGLGTSLENPATAYEAIRASGLDWKVEKTPIYLHNRQQVPDHFAVVRMKAGRIEKVLGVVGRNYVPIQNQEAFSFFDSVVGRGQAIYHTAGSLSGGKRVWILAKLPGEVRVLSTDDIIDKYLLLVNSHDGTITLKMFFTPVRVVCMNTLNLALAESRKGISIKHSGKIDSKIRKAQEVLGLGIRYYDDFGQVANKLASKMVNTNWLEQYLKSLIPDEPEKNNKRREQVRENIQFLFEYGKGADMPGIRGTAWMAVNAVAQYVDYFKKARTQDTRLDSVWFGQGAEMKQKAFELALASY